jgi:hypothetical protein
MKLMEPIFNRRRQVIGYYLDMPTRRDVLDRHARLVAWYNKSSKQTHKADGNMAGFGDQAIRFLEEN